MPLTLNQVTNLIRLCQFTCGIGRLTKIAFLQPALLTEPLKDYLETFFHQCQDNDFAFFFHSYLQRVRKRHDRNANSETSWLQEAVAPYFYPIQNYVQTKGYQTVGHALTSSNIFFTDIPTDWILYTKRLLNLDEQGAFRLIGNIPLTYTAAGASNDYPDHNCYLVTYPNLGFTDSASPLQSNYRFYTESYRFLVSPNVPSTFYAKVQYLVADGTTTDLFVQYQQTNLSPIALVEIHPYLPLAGQPPTTYKLTDPGTVQGNPPPNSKPARILELHLPNTYLFNEIDFQLYTDLVTEINFPLTGNLTTLLPTFYRLPHRP